MGLFDFLLGKKQENTVMTQISEKGNTYFAWNGNVYDSDIVRSCIRPKVKAIGKLKAKHLRKTNDSYETNPDEYIHFLLEEPNAFMTGQILQEKLITQVLLNGNAFALITRDRNGLPNAIMPIDYVKVEKVFKNSELYLKFKMHNNKEYLFNYNDIIHLKNDVNSNDLFGESPAQALSELMNVVGSIDGSIVTAIKNSAVVRWLLKFTTNVRQEDIKKHVEEFSKSFLSSQNKTSAAGIDNKMDAIQIKNENYVPNAKQLKETTKRIYAFFNTNENIVHSSFNEEQWNAYYEAEIEPFVIQLMNEYSRKLFTRQERLTNSIVFEATNLQCASMSTRLALVSLVDRGAMTINEWRMYMGLDPIDGGDEIIRRLDTAVVTTIEKGGEENANN